MSYILDALKRAEAERTRQADTTPGQTAPSGPVVWADPARGPLLPAWAWAVAGVGVTVAALAAWQWSGSGSERAPPPIATPDLTMSAPSPVSIPARTPAAPTEPAPPTATAPEPRPAATKKPKPAESPRREDPPRSAAATATTPADTPAPQTVRVTGIAALPPDLRSALPSLAFGGSVYSSAPTQRLLIINGQVFHEGDALGSGASLDEIGPRGAVLRFKGQRYEVPY
jgi:general secretion pathway protein B